MDAIETGWTPETRTLFRLARQAAHGAVQDEPAFDASLHWPRLYEQAVEDGVASLIYTRLGRTGGAPASVMARLRAAYFLLGAENALYLEHARRVFEACAGAGIEVIALRGIAFLEPLYRDVALRPMSDIDLLARPAALPALEDLLETMRYRRIDGHPHQWTNASVVLDVHTGLAGDERIKTRRRAARIDMDAVWADARPARIAGAPVKTLSWVDTLLSCCHHAIKHSCDRLVWFVDLAMLLKSPEAPWEAVIDRARRFNLTKPAYYALSYAASTIGLSVPDAVMRALRPARAGWLERRCMARVLRGEPAGRFGEVFMLFMMNRVTDRLRFILETCFPDRNVLAQAYGAGAPDRWTSRSRRLHDVAEMAMDVVRGGAAR